MRGMILFPGNNNALFFVICFGLCLQAGTELIRVERSNRLAFLKKKKTYVESVISEKNCFSVDNKLSFGEVDD